MQTFVRIINRREGNAYTSVKNAVKYVARGLAAVVNCTDNGRVTEIRMLEAAELALAKSALFHFQPRDPVTGSFEWFVGDSGGSSLMKRYAGISGGARVLQAQHGK